MEPVYAIDKCFGYLEIALEILHALNDSVGCETPHSKAIGYLEKAASEIVNVSSLLEKARERLTEE
jgi:hypothetical protein